MIDLEEFKKLFDGEPDPIGTVKEVFESSGWNPKPTKVSSKDRTCTVYDYEFFVMIIKSWMVQDKLTKEQALDKFFDMFDN